MTWQEVLDDKSLSDLPYKIELNKEGSIVMSPASNQDADFQAAITGRLYRLNKNGRVFTGCSVLTSDNVKVADVSWGSEAFLKRNRRQTPFREAPEVCVEIVSPSNTKVESERKRDLYFAKGAKEVWICNGQGWVTFFDTSGELKKSKLFPKFPAQLD